MPHIDEHSKPFQKLILRNIFGSFLVMLIVINFAVYYAQFNVIINNARTSLVEIAEKSAEHVSYASHEKIISNDQQQSSEYKEIIEYFTNVMHGNPLIFDIYTLRPTDDPNIMTFVTAARETQDANNDNYIDDSELRPDIGELYDVSNQEDLKNGLYVPSSDNEIVADKWGQWLSGYAPIKNDKGEPIAVLGVDIAASDIIAQRRSVGMPLLYIDIVLIPLLMLLSYLIAKKISKPFKTLAIGMQRVSHGELDYRLPLSGNKTEMMYEKLFNNMLGMYDNEINHLKRKKDGDFSS
ncbi:MAG: hypothetical protein WCW66_01380 [Patescibacteria group bacterium]